MGDFNDIIGNETTGLTKLCSECGLQQDIVFHKHHHHARSFNSYARGSTCIDYMLLNPELADAVQACGYEPFRIRLPSDHRGMYIDVDTLSFFGSSTQPLAPMN